MTRLLVGTDGIETSERLVEYLRDVVDGDDTVYIVHSLVGGLKTTSDEVKEGERALDELEEGLEGLATVERHEYVRGNEPVEDLLEAAEEFDVDEFAIGIRKRSPVGKMVFGSTARNLLLESDRPVRCVPLVSN